MERRIEVVNIIHASETNGFSSRRCVIDPLLKLNVLIVTMRSRNFDNNTHRAVDNILFLELQSVFPVKSPIN